MFEIAPATPSLNPLSPPAPPAGATAPSASTLTPLSTPIAAAAVSGKPEPPPSRKVRLAWYGGTLLLTVLLVFFGLRLDRADIRAPFYYDLDALLILPLVKATAERGPGGHWRNEHMGVGVTAPDRTQFQELYDFPVIDLLHFTLIWMLGLVIPNVVVLFNTYFLLTFPLTTLTAMIVFRYLGLSLPAAAVGGLLYSFLPFHYQRWENHYFLAAYWLVPLSFLPIFAICRGDLPFFDRAAEGSYGRRLKSWRSFGYGVLGVAIASGGAYYAFFTCALLSFAGVYGWVTLKTWRAAAAAGGLIAAIVLTGFILHLPTIRYQREYGHNAITDREPEEADAYGMKLAHLILPIPDHNLRVLANFRLQYLSPNRPCEVESAGGLGIVGTAGLLGLIVATLFPIRRTWPYGPLVGLTLFAILLATIGGFGSVFNLIVTSQIRAYNRISVFIAFLCLFAALWAIDRYLLTRPGPRASRIRYAAWAGLFLIGFLDQTPFAWFKSGIVKAIDRHAKRFRADGRFFAEIEQTMPPGSKIFCLPYAPFPEHRPIDKMPIYEHARGYIHTDSLYWSFGAVKGREVDAWQRDVAAPMTTTSFDKLPVAAPEFVDRIVCAGFDGLLIDTRGFALSKNGDRARTIEDLIHNRYEALVAARTKQPRPKDRAARLSLPRIAHEDNRQFFLDLRPYRDELRQALPLHYEERTRHEQDWVALLWLDGFESPEEAGYVDLMRFAPRDATAMLVNPSDRTQKLALTMNFSAASVGRFQIRLTGLVNDEFDFVRSAADFSATPPNRLAVRKSYVIEVPPGRHAIRFHCTPPPDFVAADQKGLCYYIMLFDRKEIR
jgi:hypothetical protein